ncbi:ABC-type transport system substrate-binding protein [Rhodoglobus vestalii]|uniref:ABC-type transport system substrate-binding protein n=1 Tax=Rhodoglobus vestalii TaxID=193384 RepID=A0A8H2K4V0_9MICO|nr:ABC transporter substrate-binding protein [Rhodoglobus vestalii]TQO19828.1 ABC-type transport system substrate-binding protein [Rhodoglobus vestalii]
MASFSSSTGNPDKGFAQRFRVISSIIASTISLMLVLSGCTPASVGSNEPDAEIPVVYMSAIITTNTDPAIGIDAQNLMFYRNVYEGLLEYAPGTTDLRPALAESYTVSEDGLEYTFILRDDVRFHGGAEFNADSVVASFDRMKGIGQGPAKYLTRIAKWEAVNPETVKITLNEPYSFFPGTLPWLPIVSPAAVQEHSTDDDPFATKWFSTNSDGTGPYMLDNFVPLDRLDLSAFPDYWQDFTAGVPTKVTFTEVKDTATRLELLAKGTVTFSDGGTAFAPADLTLTQKAEGISNIVQPGLSLRNIVLNTTKEGPMTDPNFRKAMILSFPYDDFLDYYEGWGDSTNGPLPPGMAGYNDQLPDFEQNLDEAEKIFEKGGWANSGVTLNMVSVEGAPFQQFAATILKDALGKFGITMNSVVLTWAQIPPLMADTNTAFDLAFLNIGANTDDPTDMFEVPFGSTNTAATGGYNWSNIQDPAIDSLIEKARNTQDEDERQSVIDELTAKVLSYNSVIYTIAPQDVNPVLAGWEDSKYDVIFGLTTVRLFYTKEIVR